MMPDELKIMGLTDDVCAESKCSLCGNKLVINEYRLPNGGDDFCFDCVTTFFDNFDELLSRGFYSNDEPQENHYFAIFCFILVWILFLGVQIWMI